MARTHYTESRYCHNTECSNYNEEVELRVTRATRYQPEEWYDDPECPVCHSDINDNEYMHDAEEEE